MESRKWPKMLTFAKKYEIDMQTVSRPYTFDRVVRLLIAGGGIVLAVWLINILKSVLLPFLVAWLIAYMLEPFVQ